MTHSVNLCLGSNFGDRCANIRTAVQALSEVLEGEILVSEMTESPSVTGIGSPYLNVVIAGHTVMQKERLRDFAKALERRAGRTDQLRDEGKISLDVDIVLFDETILKSSEYSSCYFKKCMATLKPLDLK